MRSLRAGVLLMFLWLQNYLCYQLVSLPKHVQRYFVFAGLALSLMYGLLVFYVLRDIVRPAANNEILTAEHGLYPLFVLSLTLIAYLGIKSWLLVIDNMITNAPSKDMHKQGWSWVNATILVNVLVNVIFLLFGALSIFLVEIPISLYSGIVCVFSLYVGIVANTHLIRNHVRGFALLFPFTNTLGRIFLTMPEQFTFLSDKYSGHHIEAMIKDKHALSFRNLLELHCDVRIHPTDNGDLLEKVRMFNLIKDTQYPDSMKWVILAYLLSNDTDNAGKLITECPQQLNTWLNDEDYRFFDLHAKPAEERLDALHADILTIPHVLSSKTGMSLYIRTWNLSPYAFIDSDLPEVRRTALSLL